MVEAHPRWRARVVYGDTDSLFVLLPGRSREEAFEIGSEIAAAATAANPPPVTLKMEKVCLVTRNVQTHMLLDPHKRQYMLTVSIPELLPLQS